MSKWFSKGKCGIVPPLRSPSGCEWPSNQALPFTAAGLQRAAGLTSEGPATPPPYLSTPVPVLWDPSTSFRGQMRCKSIKREFVCRSQSLWGWEPLPCHSGAANFLLLGAQTCGLPVVLTASQTLLEFQMTACCWGSRWCIITEKWNKGSIPLMLWIVFTMKCVMWFVRFRTGFHSFFVSV